MSFRNSFPIGLVFASFVLVSCGTDTTSPSAPVQQPGTSPGTSHTQTPRPSTSPSTSPLPQHTTAELSGTWAGKHMVLEVNADGSMKLNLGCNEGELPALPMDDHGYFSSAFTAHPTTQPGNDQIYTGTITGQLSGNELSLTTVMQPPHPFPGHVDSSTDVLNRGQSHPSDPLVCALSP